MRHEPSELLERRVAAQRLARLRAQRLVGPRAAEQRRRGLQTRGEVKVEVSAVEDEGAERAQVESATPPAPEPIGGDQPRALPPLDARRSGRVPCPGKDVRQA